MAKIRVAQIKDLSLTTTDGTQTLTVGAGNTITPLANVLVTETTDSVITGLSQSGNNLTATTKTFADIVSGGLVLTPAAAGTGVITSLTKNGNTLTAVYTDNTSGLEATSLAVMSGYTQDVNGKITETSTKSFNAAQFSEDANGVISLHQDVLNASTYTGTEAIEITTLTDGTKQVALKLDATDQVLTQSTDGLKANLGLVYDAAEKEIRLTGKTTGEGEAAQTAVIATIDATDFIKDGMLSEATIVSGTWAGNVFTESETGAEKAIKLVWNTDAGKDVMYINAETLVDSYSAGNEWIVFNQNTNTISHKTVDGLDSTNAHGITADVTVDSTTTKTFQVPTLTVDAAGHVVSVDEKTVTITLPASIDTAVQDGAGVDTTYIETEVERNETATNQLDVTVTAKIGTFSTTEADVVDGLATTTAVESYVEDYVANNAATTMYREVIAVANNAATLSFVPTGDVAITQNGIDLDMNGTVKEYTHTGKNVSFNLEVPAVDGDVFVAYYMYNPNTQPQPNA